MPASRTNGTGVPLRATIGGKKAVRRSQPTRSHTTHPHATSKGWTVFYIIAGAVLVLLGGTYAVYTSGHTRTPVYAIPPAEGQGVVLPVSAEEAAPTDLPPPLQEAVPEPIHANAVINVPSVGMRNAPDIKAKTMSHPLKRGEAVEIIKRHASWGPEWVKIRTTSGSAGWVFASVVSDKR